MRYRRFKLNPIWIIIAINLLMLVATYIYPRLIFLLGFGFTLGIWLVILADGTLTIKI